MTERREAEFLSTPSGWRATTGAEDFRPVRFISIHALRVEGDRLACCRQAVCRNFYPRPPGGGRRLGWEDAARTLEFLSTPSGWRATSPHDNPTRPPGHFYPRPPGGGRPKTACQNPAVRYFYPRPPGGGRQETKPPPTPPTVFLSTPSGWRATDREQDYGTPERFLSTPSGWRATFQFTFPYHFLVYFYPRPPGGGRLFRSLFRYYQP